ncbi:Folylpolyglutamate synthase [Escovopsis weberi]|uniref:Folylpolyglutamate synthase n=1 Tax=Escovopsis weberi TaxID=150374 RepID=A0A0N0RTG7_ESCWE|nr:Folylpolyglutamate synthase [Escovopsis weberi]
MSSRSYNDAIDALNSLQTPFEVVEAKRKAGIKPDESSMMEMRTYLQRIGYTPADLDRLNIIHVAGTKGKGSTCTFTDSILSQHRLRYGTPRKTGLFTSPHLIAVRERIRINSAPISEDLFARYFFQVWDRLEASTDEPSEAVPLGSKPIYGRYLALMSWHAFLQEGVDVAVYETGIGGEFDATNIVEKPLAAGITSLGIDHVYVLGDTVEKIAWHKAGIMKTGSPAFTYEQVPAAAEVLRSRAAEKQVALRELDIDPRLGGVRIRPDAAFQKRNATLAVALAESALQKFGHLESPSSALSKAFVDGLEKCVNRGRCEIKVEDKISWYIDGAHTADSLEASSKWFYGEVSGRSGPRVMIFNQQGRSEATEFLETIYRTVKGEGVEDNEPAMDHVVFCSNVTYTKTGYKRDFVYKQVNPDDVEKLTVQHRFADKWSGMDPKANVVVLRTIEDALDYARGLGRDLGPEESVQAYVTGSLHLVGGALGILEQADAL